MQHFISHSDLVQKSDWESDSIFQHESDSLDQPVREWLSPGNRAAQFLQSKPNVVARVELGGDE